MKSSFADQLNGLRLKAGITQLELSTQLSTNLTTISGWETGGLLPKRETILKIGDVLELSPAQIDSLLIAAHYESQHGTNEHERLVDKFFYRDLLRESQIQLEDIQNSLEELTNAKPTTPANEEVEHTIEKQLQLLKNSLSELRTSHRKVTKPIVFPARTDMEVVLLPRQTLERLDEYQGEENRWYLWLGFFAGALVVVLSSVIRGSEITGELWLIIITFTLMALLTGFTAFRYSKRADEIKKSLFNLFIAQDVS